MLESIMEELNITSDMISIFILIGLVLVFIYIVSAILDISKTQGNVEAYIADFEKYYESTQDIKTTMEEVMNTFKPSSAEAKALKAGIGYLDSAIIKDYKIALSYIEKVYKNADVDNMHKKILEKNRTRRQLMLEGGEK